MTIYTVNNSQGHCVGIFNDLDKAKECLMGWAESICDYPILVEPLYQYPFRPSDTIYYISDGGYRFLLSGHSSEYNEGEYTIEQWHNINEGY